MTGRRCIGLIPARAGSKRIPGKNTKLLAGKPLIVHTIEAALSSTSLWKVVVSTDSLEIAEISRKFGVEVPFIRPAYLADDGASSLDVVRHALDFFLSNGDNLTEVMLLQPTSPLRTAADIDEAAKLFWESGADTLVSVRKDPVKMATMLSGSTRGDTLFLHDSVERKGEMYQINGAIYISTVHTIIEKKSIFGENIVGYTMPPESSVDIDTLDDWRLAEMFLRGRLTET